jgi:hypothetical protein
MIPNQTSYQTETISIPAKPKISFFGEEMIEKEVRPRGNIGRVYLPPDWVGKRVKIIRID